jgi:hypothetical protein
MTQQSQPSSAPGGRPGQMTAVMRAVAATGPKVLRIGLVQSGRVIEERIIKQRTHVTVGPNEKNMFVVTAGSLPATFKLFELVGNDYSLNFLDGMTGRVALPTGISDIAMLKGQARKNQQGAYQIRLTEDSRGKVVVGDTTFLFQFVAPPPIQPKPQLPVSVTRGATTIDWATTMIAAFSFLVHFSAIGSIYSEWLDPVVDYDVNISNLLDSVKSLPPPPPVETPEEKPDKTAQAETKAAEAPKAVSSGAAAGKAGPMSAAKAAALSNQLEQMEMATLGALAGAGPATEGVLKTGEVPTGALDKAAASGAGVGVGGLSLGGGGGAIRPGAAGGGLGAIGSTGPGGGGGEGKVATVQGPRGNASTGAANVSGGQVSNAARVVAGMRAGFRNCYNRALAQNPDVEGRIALNIRVGPGGEVQGVTAAPNGNLPDSVVSCVKARAQAAQFDPPQGGMAVIQVPVTFVKQ